MMTSANSDFPKVNENWKDILKLKFDDIAGRDLEMMDMYAMQDEHAKKILDFAIKYINYDIFVSCDAGISRSPGVVVALEQIFNSQDVSDAYKYHNRFVKNKIRDVWFKSIWRKKG